MREEKNYLYHNWFSSERQYFASRVGEFPTHCILSPHIYHALIQESIRNNHTFISQAEESRILNSSEVCIMGTWIKPGISKGEDYNFYREVNIK